MKYNLKYDELFIKKLSKMDKSIQRLIMSYIDKNLKNSLEPKSLGKALKGNLKGFWRYRIMDYRLIVNIIDDELIILAVDVGHRKEIYE